MHSIKIFLYTTITAVLLSPFFVSAQSSNPTDFRSFIETILQVLLQPLVVVLNALAVVLFVYGVGKYIMHAGDPQMRAEGQKLMVYGVIGIFVMVSVWGIVEVLQNTFFP